MKGLFVVIIFACALGAVATLHADRLVFDNGDRLTGTFVGEEEGEIVFEASLLGRIRVPSQNVSVEVDEPESSAHPMPPEPVTGPMGERVEPPTRKPRFPRWNRFWEANPVFTFLGEVYPLMAWKNKIELGIDLDFGQSDRRTTSIRYQIERELRQWDFLFESSYELAETTNAEGVETTSTDRLRGRGRIRRDVNEEKAFFLQSNTRYNRDVVAKIHNEAEQTLGMGYRWLDTSRWTSSIVASLGAGYQEIGEDPGRFGFVATLYQDISYQLSESVQVSEETNLSYVPTTVNENAYLFSARMELQNRLNAQLSLNVRYEYLFDERVLNPAARTRQRITTSIGAEF